MTTIDKSLDVQGEVSGHLVVWCSAEAEISALQEAFNAHGWNIRFVHEAASLFACLEREQPLCIVVCDDPERSRLESVLFSEDFHPGDLPIIAGVRQGDVPRSVRAMQGGAVTVLEIRPEEHVPRVSSLMQAIDDYVRPAQDWRRVDPLESRV